MKRTWPIIGVADVPESYRWYGSLLGLPKTAPAHDAFGQIADLDGTVLLCLHAWGVHGHQEPHVNPTRGLPNFRSGIPTNIMSPSVHLIRPSTESDRSVTTPRSALARALLRALPDVPAAHSYAQRVNTQNE